MPKPKLIIAEYVDEVPTRARCSECPQQFQVGGLVKTGQEHRLKLNELFQQHVKEKHSEDVNQAAARIVREATKNQ